MNEIAIMSRLIDSTEREIARSGVSGRVRRLRVTLEPNSEANPNALRLAFQMLARGTRLEGAALEFEPTPEPESTTEPGRETEPVRTCCLPSVLCDTRRHYPDIHVQGPGR